ncbi:MAG: division/cell wall cluster transcriptional repressor MraZ [Actinomycetaceae bacterium]|nr:division/cell wall cluster transcriptional repressor MraZ [Arcanobacterium sp.]MDD7505415.1 division/cell wall cluster transcriptional repressor MraZ [Actinomycetaceae bacterium]MDY6142776.1 division/cell wall cluster transcriptional repressor MraZ [Arcanobacterium sp.]
MFLGTYEPVLDDKGRLILPAKFRDQLANGLVLTRGQDYCLSVYTVSAFEELLAKLQQAPVTYKEARIYSRVFTSGANDQIPDKQGRITIPASLRQYAGLSKELTVIGSGDHVEIWDRKKWDEFLVQNESSFADREEELIPGVF